MNISLIVNKGQMIKTSTNTLTENSLIEMDFKEAMQLVDAKVCSLVEDSNNLQKYKELCEKNKVNNYLTPKQIEIVDLLSQVDSLKAQVEVLVNENNKLKQSNSELEKLIENFDTTSTKKKKES